MYSLEPGIDADCYVPIHVPGCMNMTVCLRWDHGNDTRRPRHRRLDGVVVSLCDPQKDKPHFVDSV